MISSFKLSHKLILITALLALPLGVVTTMFVHQTRQINLNALEQQLTVLPFLSNVEKLVRLMQDYSAGIPLWILGTEVAADNAPRNAEAIHAALQTVLVDVRTLEGVDITAWDRLGERIQDVYSGNTDIPRGFTEYTDLTIEILNLSRLVAYKYKLYSGTDQLIVTNRMVLDLSLALADNINQLRGLLTYKIFVNERSFQDVAVISNFLSLVQYRYKEIQQSLLNLSSSDPNLFAELNSTRTVIDRELKDVTHLIQIYIDSKESVVDSARFFEQATGLMSSIYKLTAVGQKYIQGQLVAQHESHQKTLKYLVAGTVITGVVVLFLIFVISRSFVSGVRQIEIVTEEIGRGNRQIHFPEDLSGHEVKAIMEEIHKIHLAISAYEEKTRIDTWLLEGQKNLNDQIRGLGTFEEFAEKSLVTIANSIKADVGSFYRRNGPNYELSFAYGVKAPHTIKNGEGLVGAVGIDGYLRVYSSEEIPDDYARVESSLGESPARNLLIFPLRLQNEVIAILEFLSLHAFDQASLRYLRAIEENTAIMLRALQSKIQVNELLETTRNQSQDLKTSNANLEEKTQLLNEQQSLLQLVNQELEEQRSELEIQNEHLESALHDLGEAKREADVANQSKSIFLANISHELRTPLNSIMILSQVLAENREHNLQENQISNATTIHSAGRDLLKLINEILDLSKIEAGKIEINRSVVVINEVAGDLRNMYLPLAQKKEIGFEVNVTQDCPRTVETDVVRIAQIVRNFVGNGIKFTEKGQVKVDFARSVDARYALEVIVQDSGIGIPDDKFDLIFEPFKQLNNSLSRKHEGTGLGLAISKNLAARLGGEILVSSQVGEGSRFSLLIPAVLPAHLEDKSNAPAPVLLEETHDDRHRINPNDYIILIVEDDAKFAEFLQTRCHEGKFKTIVSSQGVDCVSLAETWQPHGIMLDIKLPSIDGLDILAQLKSNPRTRHIPVHVISFSDREKEALGRGAMSFYQKPVPIDKIDEILRGLLGSALQQPTVLLAVAAAREQDEISQLLAAGSFQVDKALNESHALKLLTEKSYDCLITGLNDLATDNFSLLNQLSRDRDLSTLPIVVFSNGDSSMYNQKRLASYAGTLSIREVGSMERLLDDVALFIHSVNNKLMIPPSVVIPENIFEAKKILIVDDDIRNVYALRQILHGRGCEILIASNGLEAVQTLNENADISLVLMDVMMPEMDGYEATRRIRGNPKFSRLPIIALTAKAMKNDRKLCLDAGASDYLVKPIDNDRILSLMRVWLSR